MRIAEYDSLDTVLIPDSILPSQIAAPHRNGEMEAVSRLMFAMLEDAIRCYWDIDTARNPAVYKEAAQAKWWLFGPPNGGLFSFENVCDVLEIDGAALRRELRKSRKNVTLELSGASRKIISQSRPLSRSSGSSSRPPAADTARRQNRKVEHHP